MSPKLGGRLRVALVNVAGTAVGLAIVALAVEGWARSKADFPHKAYEHYVHPRAGLVYVPGSDVRYTNNLNYWTVSRVNRWGFLDRPPFPLPEPALEPSCRVAVVGDSYVDAPQVPIPAKLHVRFEEMARSRLPELRVAASAYGMAGTGQLAQLGFYDEFVSRTSPDIVVLVFVRNDFTDNAFSNPRLWISATRGDDGAFKLRLPSGATSTSQLRIDAASAPAPTSSYAVPMLKAMATANPTWRRLRGRDSIPGPGPDDGLRFDRLEYTGFALDQWQARARRDDFFLAILASHTMGDERVFGHMERLASARDIPVVDHNAYLRRQNRRARDGAFKNDAHWTATGHQWAAEALLEWLEHNQGACGHAPSDTAASSLALRTISRTSAKRRWAS